MNNKKQTIKTMIPIIFLLIILIFILFFSLVKTQKIAYKPRASENIVMSFDRSTITAAPNTDFTVKLRVAPSTAINTRIYKAVIGFDNNQVQLKSGAFNSVVLYNIGGAAPSLEASSDVAAVNAAGRLIIAGQMAEPSGRIINRATDLVEITFTSKSASNSTITIDNTQSYVMVIKEDLTIEQKNVSTASLAINGGGSGSSGASGTSGTSGSSGTSGTSGTSGASGASGMSGTSGASGISGASGSSGASGTSGNNGPDGAVRLNLRLRFQGIDTKPKDELNKIMVKLTIAKDGANPQVQEAEFTTNGEGVWIPKNPITVNVQAGGGYKIFVKGQKHLAKRICVATPKESYPGTYRCEKGNITLQAGNNELDFSGIVLLVGDVLDKDNIVTSGDIASIRNNLGVCDNAKIVDECDIDWDGCCHTRDYSLLIQSLNTKYGDSAEENQ